MSGIPKLTLNYIPLFNYLKSVAPKIVWLRISDSLMHTDWFLRLEMSGNQMLGQRYTKSTITDGVLEKVMDYPPAALKLIFSQLFESPNSSYSLTGIKAELRNAPCAQIKTKIECTIQEVLSTYFNLAQAYAIPINNSEQRTKSFAFCYLAAVIVKLDRNPFFNIIYSEKPYPRSKLLKDDYYNLMDQHGTFKSKHCESWAKQYSNERCNVDADLARLFVGLQTLDIHVVVEDMFLSPILRRREQSEPTWEETKFDARLILHCFIGMTLYEPRERDIFDDCDNETVIDGFRKTQNLDCCEISDCDIWILLLEAKALEMARKAN